MKSDDSDGRFRVPFLIPWQVLDGLSKRLSDISSENPMDEIEVGRFEEVPWMGANT